MASDPLPESRHLDPFTVGDWLAEPKACRLSRGETVVKLRPQLMDLLVCLARRPGEIVLKDEILGEVWASQFIAESGLSRCVAELRQSLQDDAHVPRFIETVPKRGYRLVAPVAWRPRKEDGEPSGAGSAQPAAGAAADGARASARRHRLGGGRRIAVLAGIATAVAAVTVVAVLSTGGWGGRPLVTERDTVLLADVANTTGDRVFDDTLRLALGVNLGQAPFLRILPREAVRGALARSGRPPDERVAGAVALDVCRREGAAVLLATSIAPVGTRYAIGIEAIACETGEEVWRTLEKADRKEQVMDALDRAATRTRRRLGESRESLRQHNVPLVSATTSSLEALKALTLGDESRDHGRLDESVSFYRQAATLDPQFALAWARLGIALSNVGRLEEGNPAIVKAYGLIGRVSPPERFYITAHYQRNIEGQVDRALETYRAWRRLYPGSLVPPTNIASILVTLVGDFEAALPEAQEAIRLAPYSSVAAAVLTHAYRGLGRMDEARAVLDGMRGRGVIDRLISGLRLEMALADGDAAIVERETRWAATDPQAGITALFYRASAAMAAGRLREARQLWADGAARAGGLGSGLLLAEVRTFEARAEAVAGDADRARRAVDAALAANRGPYTLARAAIALALIGDLTRAGSLLDEALSVTVPDPAQHRTLVSLARAIAAARGGAVDEAVAALQPVARVELGAEYLLMPVYVRGLVERAAGRAMDAAATFERLTQRRAISPIAPWVGIAHLERARALGEAGDAAGSRAAYDAFLAAWQHADADAPLLAAARRERAALPR